MRFQSETSKSDNNVNQARSGVAKDSNYLAKTNNLSQFVMSSRRINRVENEEFIEVIKKSVEILIYNK